MGRRSGARTFITRKRIALACAAFSGLVPGLVSATDGTWNISPSGSWSDTTKWTGGVASGAGATASFVTTSGTGSVVVDGAFTIGTLDFTATNSYTLSGTLPNGLTFSSGSSVPGNINATNSQSATVHVVSAPIQLLSDLRISTDLTYTTNKLTISGAVTGATTITKLGAGVVALDGNNTAYTGQIIVSAGTLLMRNGGGAGTSSGTDVDATYVMPGGTFSLATAVQVAFNCNERVHLAGGTLTTSGSTFAGSILLDANSTAAANITGAISGSAQLTLTGSRLAGPNSYTGKTIVSAGGNTIDSSSALGATSSGTDVVTGGILTLNVPVSEPITVAGGRVNFAGSTAHTTPITSTGGTISVNAGSAPAIVLSGGTTSLLVQTNAGNRPIAGVSGVGELHVDNSNFARLTVTGPFSLTGNLGMSNGDLTLNSGGTVSGSVTIAIGSSLTANGNTTLGPVSIPGQGTLASSSGATITINGGLDIDASTINANIVGATAINRTGNFGTATLQNLGSYEGPVRALQRLTSVTSNTGLGSTVGATFVSPGASLTLAAGITVAEEIFLLNSTGLGTQGALGSTAEGGSFGTASGVVHLGQIGSVLGGENGAVRITGTVADAGILTARSLEFASPAQTYTGPTIASQGTLRVLGAGQLASTSGIVIEKAGTVLLDPSDGLDRLADTVPIALRGGVLKLNIALGHVTNETVGAVKVEKGHSVLSFTRTGTSGGNGTLTMANLQRSAGATVEILDPNFFIGGRDQMFVQTPLPLNDGILPAWLVHQPSSSFAPNFVTYSDTNGFDEVAAGSHSLNAGSAANVRLDPADRVTMTGDREINSLGLYGTGAPQDLGGFTLTIDTGGLIFADDVQVTNGRMVPGVASAGELIVHTNEDPAISASILDRSGVPTSLVKSGSGVLSLYGANSYTGTTVVNEGSLGMMAPGAIPPDGILDLAGGSFGTQFDIHFNTIRFRGGSLSISAVPHVSADEYIVESGDLTTSLASVGKVTKTSLNTATLTGNNSSFSGQIIVQEGVLQLGDGAVPEWPNALGSGLTRIDSAGTLICRSSTTNGNLQLNGGRLAAQMVDESVTVNFPGVVTVTASSSLLPINPMSFSGNVSISAGSPLTTRGPKDVSFTGNFDISGPVQRESGAGQVVAAPASGKRVTGAGSTALRLELSNGGIVAPQKPTSPIAKFTANSATFAAGGVFEWQIASATGAAGQDWDFIDITGSLQTPTTGTFNVVIQPSNLTNFDSSQTYDWLILRAGSAINFNANRFTIDSSAMQSQIQGVAILSMNVFELFASGNNLMMHYGAPLPEPGAGLIALAAMLGVRRRKTFARVKN